MNTVRLEANNNSDWGSVYCDYKDLSFAFPCHIPSGEIYNVDPTPLIRYKCVLLTIATPLISIVRTIYWLAKSAFQAIAALFYYLDAQKCWSEQFNRAEETFIDSFRALKYGTLMTGCAIGGIAAPHTFRRKYGEYERILNRQTDGPHSNKFYMARCFQYVAKISQTTPIEQDQNIPKKLNKYLKIVEIVVSQILIINVMRILATKSTAATKA